MTELERRNASPEPERAVSPVSLTTAAAGMGWASAATVASRVLSWGVTLCVAWLFAPSEFGLVMTVWVVYGIAVLLREQTVAAAIIVGSDTQAKRDTAFIASVVFSLLVALAIIALSPVLTSWTGHQALPLTIGLAAAFVISALGCVPTSLLQRSLRFFETSLAEIVAAALLIVLVLALALAGVGVASVGIAQAISALVALAIVWRAGQYRPGRAWSRAACRSLLPFGSAIFVLGLGGFLFQNLDTLYVAHALGGAPLGYYALAFNVALATTLSFTIVLQKVAFPAYATVAGSRSDLATMYSRCTRFTLAAVVPITVGLIVLGPRIVTLVFGENYAGSGPPLRVLAIYGAAAALASPAVSLFKATGRVRVAIIVVLTQSVLAFALLVLLVGSNEILGAALAVTIPAVLGAIALVVAAHRITDTAPRALLFDCRYALFASLVFVPCVITASMGLPSGATVVAFGFGALAFVTVILRVDPDLARLLRGMRPHRLHGAEAA